LTKTQRIARNRAHVNECIDLFDILGLEAGEDWELWKRPSNGQVVPCLKGFAARKMLWFIQDNPEVLEAVRRAAT
jgi:hypothetical protein